MAELNPKQLAFCQEYVVDKNGRQAAIRAGYSEKTANEQASQLLTKLHIKKKIDELLELKQGRTQITADWIIQKYLENMQMAHEQGDTKSINTALKNLAELVGANEAKKLEVNTRAKVIRDNIPDGK